MEEGVTNQEPAKPEAVQPQPFSDKARENFRKLEAAREAEREARIRAEMQAEMLRKEMEEIKNMLRPQEKDPLDDVEDYVDAPKLKAKLDKERAAFERRAEEIAKKTYEEQKRREYQEGFLQRLKMEHPDYDEIMTEQNIMELQETDPIFLRAVTKNPDEYERRKDTYEYLKLRKQSKKAAPQVQQTIHDVIEENQRNPYYIPSGTATPTAVEFDLKSKSAREAAYAKLKAAQKRPIGGAGPVINR